MPATLLKVTLLGRCFSRFSKLRKASQVLHHLKSDVKQFTLIFLYYYYYYYYDHHHHYYHYLKKKQVYSEIG